MQQRDFISRGAICRTNARNCALLSVHADTEFNRQRLLVMEQAWLALADAEDWLEGQVPPEATSAALPHSSVALTSPGNAVRATG